MQKTTESDNAVYKVLVIDDQRSLLRVMRDLFSEYGCQVVTVDSAEEAEQIIQWGERFSLVITDLKMPWLNGVEFCRRIKARHPDIRICALSGNINSFDHQELVESGFDGIYQKPLTGQLVQKILTHGKPISKPI